MIPNIYAVVQHPIEPIINISYSGNNINDYDLKSSIFIKVGWLCITRKEDKVKREALGPARKGMLVYRN